MAHLLAIDPIEHGILIDPNSSMKSLYRLITAMISLIDVHFEIDYRVPIYIIGAVITVITAFYLCILGYFLLN